VYERWTRHANRATNATYTVTHGQGSTNVPVDQQINGGAWNSLGTFQLSPGTAHKVSLTDQANGYVIADAIRLVPIQLQTSLTLYYVHPDHLNSPRLIANAAGQEVWRWDNTEPFGDTVPDENPSSLGAFPFPLRFAGTYDDPETNGLYNYFRDLDRTLGRYRQSDLIGLRGGINTYAYVANYPLRWIDRSGLDPGDLFASADDAAIDAGVFGRRQPIKFIEYGGWIYPVGICWTYNITSGTKYEVPWPALLPIRPENPTAIWHTHPDVGDPGRQNTFSGQGGERGDVSTSNALGIPIYLNTPAGSNLVYDPAKGEEREVSSLTKLRQAKKCSNCERSQ